MPDVNEAGTFAPRAQWHGAPLPTVGAIHSGLWRALGDAAAEPRSPTRDGSDGQAEDRRLALDSGFDTHLTKPVSLEQLAELVGRRQTSQGGA